MVYSKWKSSVFEPATPQHIYCKNESYFKEYEKDNKLVEILTGKRIVIVAPSPSLMGKNNGELIDSYDVVVRVGNLIPIEKKIQSDYGKKTDILINSFNEFEINIALENIEFLKSLKYIICSMVSTNFKKQHDIFFNTLRNEGILCHNVDDMYLWKLFKEIGTICNVGFSGLNVLLNYDIVELYVTGFTFYNMGKFGKVYRDDYYDIIPPGNLKKNQNKTVNYNDARFDIHDIQSQIRYFKKILKIDNRIKIDDWLEIKLSEYNG